MPRFFFHIFDDAWLSDEDGEDLADAGVALEHARQIARELLADDEASWEGTYIEVTDERGRVVGIVRPTDEAR